MTIRTLTLAVALAIGLGQTPLRAEEPQIGHMVYFTLKEPTQQNKDFFIAAGKKYLKGIDGVVFFGVGTRGEAFDRDINDKDWHVALQIVFKNKGVHDKYADHPQHLAFIADCKDKIGKVRVFDAELK